MAKDCNNTSCSRESCEGCPSRANPQSLKAPMNAESRIRHVIGIISGKGGVGKSSVTAMLAVWLKKQGFRVGILDADITGPSIPRMFGVSDLGGVIGQTILPGETAQGIKVVSINLVLEQEDQPVLWQFFCKDPDPPGLRVLQAHFPVHYSVVPVFPVSQT